jgi:2-phosphosulfolactate phosphatase
MSAETAGDQKIEVCFSPHDYEIYGGDDNIVVIIDILRATTAMCTAFEYGAEKIIPVASVKEATAYKAKGFLVGAERNAIQLEGFDFGNSPYHFMCDKVKGKTLVITTTNGTQAIEKAKDAHKVVIGSFLNIDVLCKWLAAQNKNVLLLCSGWKNRFCLEDAMFAGAVVDNLSGQAEFEKMGDSALAAKYLYQSAKADTYKFLRKSSHRKRLWDLNLKEDVKYCLSITKQLDFIPILKDGAIIKMKVSAKANINA